MKKIFLFLFFSFFVHSLFAQLTQAEIDKMIKDAQELAKNGGNDSLAKKLLKDAEELIKKTGANSNPGNKTSNTGKLPAKNTALLSAIPKKTFTKAELVIYIGELYKQLAAKISPAKVKAVNDMMTRSGGTTYKFNLAAVASWYNGADEEAVLIAMKAAMKDPDDGVVLNNLSAMLNMGGLEQKAIPILRTLLKEYPDNPMVLNNMGQAFAGLGDVDSAMVYLGRCINKSPNHPEANNTAGEVELSKGNVQKAKEHFENSLKGAYNNEASRGLKNIDSKRRFGKLIRPRIHIPEYFNPAKYKLPPQCENLQQAALSKAEHDAFDKMLNSLITKYNVIEKEEGKIAEQIFTQTGGLKWAQTLPTFWELASTMVAETSSDYLDEVVRLDLYNKNFTQEFKNLESKYEQEQKNVRSTFHERSEKVGEGNGDPTLDKEICQAYENVANKYLLLFSNLRRDWQVKNLAPQKKYLNELIYWYYLSSHNIHQFRQIFYARVVEYLTTLKKVNETKIIYPCKQDDGDKQNYEELGITEPECPFEIEIKFIVGKFSLDCESVSFSGGEGFVFKYDKKFKSGQSTLSLGIGAQLELGGGFGGVKLGAGASVSESLFIQLGSNGQVTDAGLKFVVKAGAAAELEGAIGKRVNVKKDLSKVETEVGYTIGIESGIKFNEGPLKKLLN